MPPEMSHQSPLSELLEATDDNFFKYYSVKKEHVLNSTLPSVIQTNL